MQWFDDLVKNNTATLISDIQKDNPVAPQIGARVYQQNILNAWGSACAAIFPLTCAVLGDAYFRQCVRFYCQSIEQHSRDLNQMGEDFPDFFNTLMAKDPELKSFAFLPDLARYEYALNQAYYADAAKQFDAERFATLSEAAVDNVHFKLADSVSVYSTSYSLLKVIKALREETPLEASDLLANKTAEYFVIHRDETTFELKTTPISAIDFEALTALINGISFSNLCERYQSLQNHKTPTPPPIGEWIANGWVDDFAS